MELIWINSSTLIFERFSKNYDSVNEFDDYWDTVVEFNEKYYLQSSHLYTQED